MYYGIKWPELTLVSHPTLQFLTGIFEKQSVQVAEIRFCSLYEHLFTCEQITCITLGNPRTCEGSQFNEQKKVAVEILLRYDFIQITDVILSIAFLVLVWLQCRVLRFCYPDQPAFSCHPYHLIFWALGQV